MSVELLDKPAIAGDRNSPRIAANLRTETKGPVLGRAAQGGTLSTITIVFMVLFHIGAVAALCLTRPT